MKSAITAILLLATTLLACGSALAADPITLSLSSDGSMTILTNTSGRDIRAFLVTINREDGPQNDFMARHDHFFSRDLMPNGFTDQEEYTGDAKVQWVEFADGTTWGEPVYGGKVLQMRKDMLFLYQTLAATTTDVDFQSALVRVRGDNDMARREVQDTINASGIAAARTLVGKRLANAKSRTN